MVGIKSIPEQGGLSAYIETTRPVRPSAPGYQEQTADCSKTGAEEQTAVKNDGACRDRAVWTWTEDSDNWKENAVHMLEQLKKQYPDIVFHLADGKDAEDLAGLAVRAGTGIHLYLSREFVERMGSSREEFGQCYSELVSVAGKLWANRGQTRALGAFLGENGVSYWFVKDKADKEVVPAVSHSAVEETPSAGSDPRMRVIVSLNVSNHFSRVARARTKGQVQEAMWDIHRSISNLKRAAACGDDQQRVKASRALRSLQKLLGRGGRKMRKLDREQLKLQEQKKAEKKQQAKRALRLKQEQKRMRSARLGADACLVKEGHGDDFYIQSYRQYAGSPYKWEYQMPDGTMAGLFDAAPSVGAGITGAAEAGFTAADVVVTGDIL
ncbi:MAG: hypothetical protein LUK37_11095 [Clostridia bacterium]|nr:hypothetical protein [Clostridia bacterium]